MGIMNLFSRPSNAKSIERIRKITGMSQEEFDKIVSVDDAGAYYAKNALLFASELNTSQYQVKEGTQLIQRSAFWDSNVKNVTLPESVRTIEVYAFDGAKELTEVNIPNGVREIKEGTFQGCESLQSISLPKSCTSIAKKAFDGCKSLKKVDINQIVSCDVADNAEKKEVGNYAFNDCKSLKTVEMPEGVTTIGEYAFKECEALTSVKLPSTLETIQQGAFWDCFSLSELDIPEFVNDIQMSSMPSGLKTIVLHSATMHIAKLAFIKCENIEKIIVPKGAAEKFKEIFSKTIGPIKIKLSKGENIIEESL